MAEGKTKYSRRTMALFWCGVVALVIGSLIYFEQIPMLYVVATVALVVLLLVVGFSDLEKVGRDSLEGFAAKED
ncbi:MAG: hypothetical protein OEQ28_07280 [Acidobacteriota bacterium]|nr:hypothetical protein [Acidobacteriota bacterium]